MIFIKMKSFFQKHLWVFLTVFVLIFDVIWIVNSNFFNPKSNVVVNMRDNDSIIFSLFQSSYHKVIIAINAEDEGCFNLESSNFFLAIIKNKSDDKNQCFISLKSNINFLDYHCKISLNQANNEFVVISKNLLFWSLNNNKHFFYKINVLFTLFFFLFLLRRCNI